MGRYSTRNRLAPVSTAVMASIAAPDPEAPPPISAAMRRELLGDFGAMLILVPSAAGAEKAAELDGELIACCRRAKAIDAEADALLAEVLVLADDHPRLVAIAGEAYELLATVESAAARAARLPARTPEGLRAKAQLAALLLPDGIAGGTAVALSLARDLTGWQA